MIGDIFPTILDIVLDVIYFWDDTDKQRILDIKNAGEKILSGHEDVVLDSNKSYLLLNTNQGLYLVSRRDAWKAKLRDTEEALYISKGRRAFSRIRKSFKECA